MDPIQRLDAYLSSNDSPEDSMAIYDLDGFLTGVACMQSDISEARWMAVALGEVRDRQRP